MRVEIVLFLVLEVVLAAAPLHNGDGVEFDVLEDQSPPKELRVRKGMTVNVHPGDIEAIKGVIKKLLGRNEIDHIKYHAPTVPTRSSPTEEATQSPTKTSNFLSSLTEGFRPDPEGLIPTGRPDMLVPDRSSFGRLGTQTLVPDRSTVSESEATREPKMTRSESIQKLDWFENQELELATAFSSEGLPLPISPGVTWNVTQTSAMRVDQEKYMAEMMGRENASAIVRQFPAAAGLRIPFGHRTRHTRRTTASTRNTLCTEDSDDVCRTMCFDRDKYRIPCPTTRPRQTTPHLDITKLLKMISGLVADYDTNLTAVMNKTLLEKGYRQCEPTTTTTTTTTMVPPPTPPMYDYEPSSLTGTVISKCYVCGMVELGIPLNAHCADPFAKDLLPPAMPDHVAETKRKGYRKYCNYMDMKPWYINGSGIWGKWSGGCVVRWVDLSGIYTQRVCRIRERPAIGRHFISKRLAKLEYALRKVDNGCMLSPVATLVPFSRGVSLYARLHVCVCSANWCNVADRPRSVQWFWAAMGLLTAVLR